MTLIQNDLQLISMLHLIKSDILSKNYGERTQTKPYKNMDISGIKTVQYVVIYLQKAGISLNLNGEMTTVIFQNMCLVN